MATFSEANRVRLSLKMKLSQYYWYNSSVILSNNGDYFISLCLKKLDNQIRKLIAPVIDGVEIKMEIK